MLTEAAEQKVEPTFINYYCSCLPVKSLPLPSSKSKIIDYKKHKNQWHSNYAKKKKKRERERRRRNTEGKETGRERRISNKDWQKIHPRKKVLRNRRKIPQQKLCIEDLKNDEFDPRMEQRWDARIVEYGEKRDNWAQKTK